ncbi:(d)CMP kinase [Thermicanus aegyptius]|uniref:(d)CMP kinase n=1 Tax=Thermicanus aegyptius TaxID=94009 RepID=UPI00048BA7EA|nr:(d)CMP kinase [Thermicanus aegyptius]
MRIAIDGPAGAGKSTIARSLAARLKALYIDTGAMYRALTLKAKEAGVSADDEAGLTKLLEETEIRLFSTGEGSERVVMDGRDVTEAIRHPDISRLVSIVSKHPRVREIMVNRQRKMAEEGDVVMDGRDIGTVVLPYADLKIFLTASIQERAMRRYRELWEKGHSPNLSQLEEEIKKRDRLDAERSHSPLKKAEDAILVDTTHLTIQEVVDRLYSLCKNGKG